MPLAPGPFRQLSQDAVSTEPGVYDFTDDAQSLSGQLNTIYDSWDPLMAEFSAMASDPLTDIEDLTIDGAIAALGVADVMAGFPSIDTSVQAFSVGDTQLTAAVAFAPDQAWVNPPAPYVPPDGLPPVIVPTIPTDSFIPGQYVGGGASGNANSPRVQLLNLTRVGQINFTVGDQFQVLAFGKAGDKVTVTATHDGKDLGLSDMGQLDAAGNFQVSGTMPPDNAGAWFEIWYLGGQPITSFNFVVTPSGAQL